MPTLTLEAIRQNPWNAVTHDLPAHPSHQLLTLAQLAAACCRQIEADLVLATDDGDATISTPETRDSTDRFLKANRRIGEICGLFEEHFGIEAKDYLLPRNSA
jgi:hypothetical protein